MAEKTVRSKPWANHTVQGDDGKKRPYACPCVTPSYWANGDPALLNFKDGKILAKMEKAGYIDVAEMDGWAGWTLDQAEEFALQNRPAARAEYQTTNVPRKVDPEAMEIDESDGDAGSIDVDDKTYDSLIHPCFRRHLWNNMDEKMWSFTECAARLATRILEEPSILPFFNGFVNNIRPLIDQQATDRWGDEVKLRHFNSLGFTGEDAQGEMMTLWKVLAALAKCIRWEYNTKKGVNSYAATGRDDTVEGLGAAGETNGSLIMITHDFVWIMRGTAPLSKFVDDNSHQYAFEEDSAVRRRLLILAVTMVHELCHALEIALTPRPKADPKLTSEHSGSEPSESGSEQSESEEPGIPTVEPFYSNHRVAELGWAFESVVFGGIVDPLGCFVAAPYGLSIHEFPGLHEVKSKNSKYPGIAANQSAERGSPIKFGRTKESVYPVHMFYVAKLFTQEFWEREVTERGLEAFVPPRDEALVGWLVENDFRDDESEEVFTIGTDGIARSTKIEPHTLHTSDGPETPEERSASSSATGPAPAAPVTPAGWGSATIPTPAGPAFSPLTPDLVPFAPARSPPTFKTPPEQASPLNIIKKRKTPPGSGAPLRRPKH